ncbi:MAG: 1-deoxy-D-xylulose-5-phosphate synthase N-terminal domain-containing protein, partial [bacterium]|nr:1-deoxy-D-xylulose-5-phosphate synthase N-terminal domain-containing protein [bacterium]
MNDAKIKNDPIYLNLQNADLPVPAGVNIRLLERLAKVVRGFLFAAVEAGQSGHPGSSSKVEEILSLVLGLPLAYNPINPKHPGRDRIVWSAGHCTPALFGTNALIYECLRRVGRQFSEAVVHPIFPEDLVRFRHVDGPQGHAESIHPLSDYSTGPSGHGLSAAGGMAIVHKSCGLSTKVWVMMGDAESEEGMTYEARNILATTGTNNIVVTLDYNHFGIDGPIEDVISSPYINHWLGLGWNVIEVDGHNFVELITAYRTAEKGFENKKPTVILAHTLKGKSYGNRENTALSHGSPIPHDEYVAVMNNLGFAIPGKKDEAGADIETVLMTLTAEEEKYVAEKLEEGSEKILAEQKLVEIMKDALTDRSFVNPINIHRPKTLPPELIFAPGSKIATRKAAGIFFAWLMKQSAFVYTGAGDVGGSIGTSPTEKIYGLYNSQNPTGRGIRFGIAEQNMAMMSVGLTNDILPGGYQP